MTRLEKGILALVAVGLAAICGRAVAEAADDTARFFGKWQTSVPYNGQIVTMVSVHDANGYKNYIVLPTGNTPASEGTFSAANGRYTTSADKPNDTGTYRFINDNTVICTNAAGQTVVWKRIKAPEPQTPAAQPAPPPPTRRADAADVAAPKALGASFEATL